ncbi:MAG: VOC family protein [Alphaproteobacteria bacterium]
MTINRVFGLPLICLAIVIAGCSPSPEKPDQINEVTASPSCLSGIELPSMFIALTSNFESELGSWYSQLFDLEVVKEFQSPDGDMRGTLMRRGNFVVEIFYQKKLNDRNSFVQNSQPSQWKGYRKTGVYVDANIRQLKDCFLENGISAGRIFRDDNLNIDLLLVRDPEDNIIEMIEKHK